MKSRLAEMHGALRDRFKPEWSNDPALSDLASLFDGPLNVVSAVSIKRNALEASGRLSPKGLVEETRAFAEKEARPMICKAIKAVQDVRAGVNARRNAISTPQPDPNDVAGALLRGEMRAWLKTLPPGVALQKLMGGAADERLQIAAVEMPAEMSGLSAQIQNQVKNDIVQRHHQPQLKRLVELESAADLASAAIGVASYQLQRDAGFGENAAVFESWIAKGAAPA